MPASANTWNVLQAMQARIFNEVLVGGVSPFSTWNSADQTKYGTNPYVPGGVSTAIYIGVPKDWPSRGYLPHQCHIIPPMQEHVYWRALGGKTWDDGTYYVRFVYSRHDDWYQAQQDIIAARDAWYAQMAKHAELMNAPTVRASQFDVARQVPAYHHDGAIGDEWDCWGFAWKISQEFYAVGGVQP